MFGVPLLSRPTSYRQSATPWGQERIGCRDLHLQTNGFRSRKPGRGIWSLVDVGPQIKLLAELGLDRRTLLNVVTLKGQGHVFLEPLVFELHLERFDLGTEIGVVALALLLSTPILVACCDRLECDLCAGPAGHVGHVGHVDHVGEEKRLMRMMMKSGDQSQ